MGHLAYCEEEKTIYCFGGLNSQGLNYKLKLDEKDWQQQDKRHSDVANSLAMELNNNSSIYFSRLEVFALNV